MIGIHRLVPDLHALRSGRLEVNFVRRAEEHGLMWRRMALAQLLADIVEECQCVLAAGVGVDLGLPVSRSARYRAAGGIERFLIIHFLGTMRGIFLKLRRAKTSERFGTKSVAHGESGDAGVEVELKMHAGLRLPVDNFLGAGSAQRGFAQTHATGPVDAVTQGLI